MTSKQAIERIGEIRYFLSGLGTRFVEKDLEAVDMAIEALESNRWIPVGERLPEYFKDVLLFNQRGMITIFYLTPNSDWSLAKITHWMPLPEPPEKDEVPT